MIMHASLAMKKHLIVHINMWKYNFHVFLEIYLGDILY